MVEIIQRREIKIILKERSWTKWSQEINSILNPEKHTINPNKITLKQTEHHGPTRLKPILTIPLPQNTISLAQYEITQHT